MPNSNNEYKISGVGGNYAAKTMTCVNEAVAPFLPLVTVITTLTKEIADAYENVQYNKKTCGALVTRVEAVEVAIKGLIRQKEENIDKFCNQSYYNSFSKLANCLKQIKEFFNDISQLSKFKKFVSSGSIKDTFEKIVKDLDSCSIDLNLAISIATEQLNSILHSDMIEMKMFLDNIEGGITYLVNDRKTNVNSTELSVDNKNIVIKINNIEEQNQKIIEQNNELLEYKDKQKTLNFTPLNGEIDAIRFLNENDTNSKVDPEAKAKGIDPLDLKDAAEHVKRGKKETVLKKVYKTMDVACKHIPMDKIVQKHLAILGKLEACPYIIRFYGLSKLERGNVMVFEWAEYGNLRQVYLNYNIGWDTKISLARDICRGLIFLHAVKILHHDIRCENVLITEKMQPKICNFKFSREFHAVTSQIDDMNAIVHWLAPEKLKNITSDPDPKKYNNKTSYTIQCDIFSFVMLLWELGFQKKPYENMSISDIQKHVLKGKREILDEGLSPNLIKKEYCEIIKLGWEQEASLRPGIQQIFNMLQKLYEKHVLRVSPHLRPKEEVIDVDEDIHNLSILDHDKRVIPLTPFKEGLVAHKKHEFKKAWNCFEEHAKVGDILAKYWQGYYYLEGKCVEKDLKKAKELFKEAADGGNADAQLRYAFCLIDKENEHIDYTKFLKYLKMSADNDNSTALYNLGEMYFNGRMGVETDQVKGIQYLKLAALKGQPKAKEILKNNNIIYYN
ncbi:5180_t:CDS:2 [Funneliformis geosporum]|uniref:14821_t:CDS:1 n=1 Tax=Funneliformis geosporum TaxID=1117311 RepID=A0A9W4SSP8_9GLOM|nr:14821_t:CDS:2 [Funneliformis geosporum]CAI2179915.1 5180_t:CDS:2 [Funneliformis geosporum]